MDDEQKQLKAVSRAHKAKVFVESEVFKDAKDYIKKEMTDRWMASTQADERERIWLILQALERIDNVLALFMRDGKVAKAVLDQLAEGRQAA